MGEGTICIIFIVESLGGAANDIGSTQKPVLRILGVMCQLLLDTRFPVGAIERRQVNY